MTRADIIAEAASWIGTPYHHQASLKGVGADCLGLVRGVWRGVYGAEPLVIPAYAQEPNEAPGGEALIEGAREHLIVGTAAPQPGDLLVFRLRENLPARHCAILIAPERFVHAVSGRSVSGAAFGTWWRWRLAAHFAFPGLED
jgi:NlpC/P60 family putative phage cell wall peptidase